MVHAVLRPYAETLEHVGRYWCRSGDHEPQAAAKLCLDLGKHKSIPKAMLVDASLLEQLCLLRECLVKQFPALGQLQLSGRSGVSVCTNTQSQCGGPRYLLMQPLLLTRFKMALCMRVSSLGTTAITVGRRAAMSAFSLRTSPR